MGELMIDKRFYIMIGLAALHYDGGFKKFFILTSFIYDIGLFYTAYG